MSKFMLICVSKNHHHQKERYCICAKLVLVDLYNDNVIIYIMYQNDITQPFHLNFDRLAESKVRQLTDISNDCRARKNLSNSHVRKKYMKWVKDTSQIEMKSYLLLDVMTSIIQSIFLIQLIFIFEIIRFDLLHISVIKYAFCFVMQQNVLCDNFVSVFNFFFTFSFIILKCSQPLKWI